MRSLVAALSFIYKTIVLGAIVSSYIDDRWFLSNFMLSLRSVYFLNYLFPVLSLFIIVSLYQQPRNKNTNVSNKAAK